MLMLHAQLHAGHTVTWALADWQKVTALHFSILQQVEKLDPRPKSWNRVFSDGSIQTTVEREGFQVISGRCGGPAGAQRERIAWMPLGELG